MNDFLRNQRFAPAKTEGTTVHNSLAHTNFNNTTDTHTHTHVWILGLSKLGLGVLGLGVLGVGILGLGVLGLGVLCLGIGSGKVCELAMDVW